jgi:hypothetical protein
MGSMNPFVRLLPKGRTQAAVFPMGVLSPAGFEGLAPKGAAIIDTLQPQDTQDYLISLTEGFVLFSITGLSQQTDGFGYWVFDAGQQASFTDRPILSGVALTKAANVAMEGEPYTFTALQGKSPQAHVRLVNRSASTNIVSFMLRGYAKFMPL